MNKKLLIVAFFMMFLLFPEKILAYDCEVGGIYYNLDSETKTATVTYRTASYNSYSGGVTIPKNITYNNNEYTVTSIGTNAFTRCDGLTSVTIGNSVYSIEESAFSHCRNVTSITFPASVTSIEDYVFTGCTGIKSVKFEDGNEQLSIGVNSTHEGLFYDSPLETLYLGRNLSYSNSNKEGYSPFDSRTTLKDVIIGNFVTTIHDYAFRNCSGLINLSIGNSVTTIGNYAFNGCSSLTNVIIPDSVTTIGNYAFYGCSSLTNVIIPNSVTTIGNYAFRGCNSLTNVIIPNSVISIGNDAFYGCSSLTNVVIPNSVTSIGVYAFSYCSSLTNVVIPNSVTSIGSYAFYGCKGLTNMIIGNSVETLGKYAFKGCTGLKSVKFEDGENILSVGYMEVAEESLFYDCPLESLYLGRTLYYETSFNYKRGGWSPFYGKETLKEVTIGKTVTDLGDFLFRRCTGLKSVIFEDGDKTLSLGCNMIYLGGSGEGLFFDCPVESLYLGRDVSYRFSFFDDKITLKELTIGNSVTKIGGFWGCTGLSKIIISNSVKFINGRAFYDCSGLTNVFIGNSVAEIGEDAFSGCTSLTSITIPGSVISIGNYAFKGCKGLKSLKFENGEKTLSLGYNYYNNSPYTPQDGQGLFYDCPLESLYLGRNLSYDASYRTGNSPFYRKPN